MFKAHCYRLVFLSLILALSVTALRAQPNVLGTFTGSLSGNIFIAGSVPSPTTQTVTITVGSQNGMTITGTVSLSPANLSYTFNGSIGPSGDISAIINTPGQFISDFTGVFNGNSLTLSRLFIDDSLDQYDLTGSLSFSGSGIVDPETAAGTVIKNAGTIQSEILGITSPIQQHLLKTLRAETRGLNLNEQGFFLEGESGLNAGDLQLGTIGVWLSYNYRDSENDFSRTAFESHSHTAVGGIDYSPNDRLVLGMAFAYEYSDTDTTFNAGNLKSDGYTIAPYIAVLLSDTWSLDASLGASFIDNDQFRTDPNTAVRISSDPDTDRFFISANLNGVSYHNNWILGGRLGYLFARSTTENFTESDNTVVGKRRTKLGQIKIGGDVAYSYQNWEPFVSATYEYDYLLDEIQLTAGPQPANDRDDVLFATGFRYYNTSGLSSSFEYSKRLFRKDFDEDSWVLNLRYNF